MSMKFDFLILVAFTFIIAIMVGVILYFGNISYTNKVAVFAGTFLSAGFILNLTKPEVKDGKLVIPNVTFEMVTLGVFVLLGFFFLVALWFEYLEGGIVLVATGTLVATLLTIAGSKE